MSSKYRRPSLSVSPWATTLPPESFRTKWTPASGSSVSESILVTMMLPAQVLMIPQYIWYQKLGWVGSYAGPLMGFLTMAVACLRELLLEGKRIKLGDLGDFQPRLKTEGAVTTEDFTASNIKAVNISWEPGKNFENLRSEAEFQLVPSRKLAADAIEVIKNTDTIQGLE